MGWADLLVRTGVPYNSEEGIEAARIVMRFIDEESKKASEKLAEQQNVFPAWQESIWGPDETCARDATGERVRPLRRLRNCNVTTVAPTGTISIFADCSGGIEPLFAVAFMRNQAGAIMPDVNKDFVRLAQREGWYSEALIQAIAQEGHIHFPEVPAEVQRIFVTAHDVTPEWHIRMQAAFQEHVDSAISKTCNFGHGATAEDVRKIYLMAYELECKGVTVYRDGCRPMQVLSTGKTGQEMKATNAAAEAAAAEAAASPAVLDSELADVREENNRLHHEVEELRATLAEAEGRLQRRRQKRSRPSVLRGTTRRMPSPLGDLYVTINEDESGKPFEVFATLGKAGGAAMADVEAIGRLISLSLRSGISLGDVYQQLRGISCDRAVGLGPNKVLSVPDGIAQAIAQHEREKAGVQQELPMAGPQAPVPPAAAPLPAGGAPQAGQTAFEFGYDPGQSFIGTCPECHSDLQFMEGCVKCMSCGFSECG